MRIPATTRRFCFSSWLFNYLRVCGGTFANVLGYGRPGILSIVLLLILHVAVPLHERPLARILLSNTPSNSENCF